MERIEAKNFPAYSNCTADDIFHPEYHRICAILHEQPRVHRKQWEFVYIAHQLERAGMLQAGRRGLGFGVGKEPLPAVFAGLGCEIMATDAPLDVIDGVGWTETNQHVAAVGHLRHEGLIAPKTFFERVRFTPCNMKNVPATLENYDFCWSSCALEHLGSLQAGIDFVVRSIDTLRIGGVACHTTELNVDTSGRTIEYGGTVLYRPVDIRYMVEKIEQLGHQVDPIQIGQGEHELDQHIDAPPYSEDKHLRLRLGEYVTTSIGLTIRRGP